jgi:hypothetical protein
MFIEDVCWCRHKCCYKNEANALYSAYWDCYNYNFNDEGDYECDCHQPLERPWEDLTWD